jgi:DNA polymerase delta subunit 2
LCNTPPPWFGGGGGGVRGVGGRGGGGPPPPPPPPPRRFDVASSAGGAGGTDAEDGSNVAGGGGGGKRRRDYNVVAASESSTRNDRNNDAAMHVTRALLELDVYLSELLGSGIPVDYVPGWHDPTNANWPQRPLHSCLLPRSAGYANLFCRGTNPYECVLGGGDDDDGGGGGGGGGGNGGNGVRVLGSDGLNIADLRRFLPTTARTTAAGQRGTTIDDDDDTNPIVVGPMSCIDALHRTLVYGHLAPTGPDSLPTFPSCDYDPFVLTCRPNVYFAGNCDAYETRLVNGRGEEIINDGGTMATTTASTSIANDDVGGMTRLVYVPSFALTGQVVLVKLRSLECEVLTFNDVPN